MVAGLVGLYFYKKYQVAPSIDVFSQKLYDENNTEVNLNVYKGKPLIISFYASWCGNCIQELNELNEIKDSELKDVTVICITDESAEKLISFKEHRNFPFTFFRLNKSFPEIGIEAIPVTYLINTKGEVVYNNVGAIQWTDNSFLQFAKKAME